jgi:hypothetical protein
VSVLCCAVLVRPDGEIDTEMDACMDCIVMDCLIGYSVIRCMG